MNKDLKILDCTLRDGGYYTNWDFESHIIKSYFNNINDLPIDYIEIGYRNKKQNGYFGQFFYTPTYILEKIKTDTSKSLAIIINEKDVLPKDLKNLLNPIKDYIDLIRIAIDPKNFNRALILAEGIQKLGFKVGFNVMYMSEWEKDKSFFENLGNINGLADFLYMVDSFGGVYPEDVVRISSRLKEVVKCELGFHGHNNLELALINTITAIQCGVTIVDSTITGMGRGAGNLKTELLLSSLNAKNNLDVDFNALSKVVTSFTSVQDEHKWGTNLPYMVSGANSLPQKDVMEWMSKRFYSLNSIIRALTNKSKGVEDNVKLNSFKGADSKEGEVLIVGGGNSIKEHSDGLSHYINNNPNMLIIHASSKNALFFKDVPNKQIFCLLGNEGHRLEAIFDNLSAINGECILPPYPRKMGTYIPEQLLNNTTELEHKDSIFSSISQTAMALEIVLKAKLSLAYFIGFDGYSGNNISSKDQELFIENDKLFKEAIEKGVSLVSLTSTKYKQLQEGSLYSIY